MQQTLGLPPLPIPTDGPWPCRAGTVEKRTLRFATPYSLKEVRSWIDRLDDWEKLETAPAAGRAALAVLRGLVKFMNWRTGRCDPSWASIGKKAKYSRGTVHTALRWLRDAGVIDWIPCCKPATGRDGRFLLKQETSVYILRPPSQWRGYRDPTPPAPPPEPDTWGATPPLPTGGEQAIRARQAGASMREQAELMLLDPDPGTQACGRAILRNLAREAAAKATAPPQ